MRLANVLGSRRWRWVWKPFPHVRSYSVFSDTFYRSLAAAFADVMSHGLSESPDRSRFSKNMRYSDAYAYDFPPDIDGPLAVFYSAEWHDLLAGLFGADGISGDVNAALHHHHVMSANGRPHRDLGICWFSSQPRADGINPMDLSRCSYTSGAIFSGGVEPVVRVRAITMVYYLANPPWNPGAGGETGLYSSPDDDVTQPAARVPPVNNSLVAFENTPASYHAFLQNTSQPRNSVVLWLHRGYDAAAGRWGESAIGGW